MRSWPCGKRQALAGLALLLAPGLAPESTAARSRQREWRPPESTPYLIATGPPGLRFCAPVVPAEPELRPVASGPPVPGLNAQETVVAAANTAALRAPPDHGPPRPGLEPGPASVAVPTAPAPPAAPKRTPTAILPDDTRSEIRAEDFLPYFQAPGVRTSGTGSGLPPSSATYTQSPR